MVGEFDGAAQFGAGTTTPWFRPFEFGVPRDFGDRANGKAAALSSDVASDRTVEVESLEEREQVATDVAVEINVFAPHRGCASDLALTIEIEVTCPGHYVLANGSRDRERLAGRADVAVNRAIHGDELAAAEDVALDVAVHGYGARPGDQVAVDISIDHGAIGGDDEICLHLLPRSQCVIRMSMLGVCGSGGRRKRNRAKSCGHHDGERRRAPKATAQQPHYYESQSRHRREFHRASHCVPSFPK